MKKGMTMISYVIIIIVVVIATILFLTVINPMIEQGKEMQAYNEAVQILNTINKEVREVMFEPPGTKRVLNLDIREGSLDVSGKENKIKLKLENVKYLSPGKAQEGNIVVRAGAWMDATETDIDGDNNTELVLQNDAVIFATKKLGSPSSHVAVNTTNFIKLIRNIRSDVNITNPRTAIYINDDPATSTGTGYIELTREGVNIPSSGIKLWLNSTAGNVYEVVFTVGAETDYIEMSIRIIE
jgi:type II secretory pathway pseudopilin PulG